jgi:excisionase family DNA binding protein
MASIDWSERLLLRLPEAAVVLGLGRSTVYELVQRGELPSVHVGRAVRIPAMALRRWVEQRSTGADSDAPILGPIPE